MSPVKKRTPVFGEGVIMCLNDIFFILKTHGDDSGREAERQRVSCSGNQADGVGHADRFELRIERGGSVTYRSTVSSGSDNGTVSAENSGNGERQPGASVTFETACTFSCTDNGFVFDLQYIHTTPELIVFTQFGVEAQSDFPEALFFAAVEGLTFKVIKSCAFFHFKFKTAVFSGENKFVFLRSSGKFEFFFCLAVKAIKFTFDTINFKAGISGETESSVKRNCCKNQQ